MGNRTLVKPAAIIELLVHAIERKLMWEPGGQPKFAQLCADFIKDEAGHWWMLQVKCIKFFKNPGRMVNNRRDSEESASKMIISRSTPNFHGRIIESSILLNRSTKMSAILLQQAVGCELCGLQGFEKNEMFTMSASMIARMLHIFELRGIHLRCLSCSKIPLLIEKGFGEFRICRMCYEIYKAQEKLMSVGQEYQNVVRARKNWKKGQKIAKRIGVTQVGIGPTLDLRNDDEPKNEHSNLFKFRIVLILHRIFGFEAKVLKSQFANTRFTLDYKFGHTEFRSKLSPLTSGYVHECYEVPLRMLSVHELYATSASMINLLKVKVVNLELYNRARVSDKRIHEAQIPFTLENLVLGVMNNRDMKHDLVLPVKTKSFGECWASVSIGLLSDRKQGGCSVDVLSSQRSYLSEDSIYWEVDNQFCLDLLPSEWLEGESKAMQVFLFCISIFFWLMNMNLKTSLSSEYSTYIARCHA
jgi:hypothetical protein